MIGIVKLAFVSAGLAATLVTIMDTSVVRSAPRSDQAMRSRIQILPAFDHADGSAVGAPTR